MKYFKIFNTSEEYYAYAESADFITPNISVLTDSSQTWINPQEENHKFEYLTFVALEDGTFTFNASTGTNVVSYSLDSGSTWTELENNAASPTVTRGNTIQFKGEMTPLSSSQIGVGTFSSTNNFDVEGNPMSLLYGDEFKGQKTLVGTHTFKGLFSECTNVINAENMELVATATTQACYSRMFEGCTSLVASPKILPSLTTTNYCYDNMFKGCTSLITSPELLATTLAEGCYKNMFSECTSLTVTPILPAKTVGWHSYKGMFDSCTALTEVSEMSFEVTSKESCMNMFSGCTSLTTVPNLKLSGVTGQVDHSLAYMFQNCTSLVNAPTISATTIGSVGKYSGVYRCMFKGCTSLRNVQILPATTLGNNCYHAMFAGCTSLTTVPSGMLPATTLASDCYKEMFSGCTSLIATPQLSATTLATNCYTNMFRGCSALTTSTNVTIGCGDIPMASSACTEMFRGCTSLTTVPSLPATTLADRCYENMFWSCTSLTAVPSGMLPATTLGNYCYKNMFTSCKSLTVAPALLATTLANNCYEHMFEGCTSLTVAPDLLAPTLLDSCYYQMFKVTKVEYVKCLATDISATNCTYQWLFQAPNTTGCTFVKHSTMSSWTRDVNGIPSNWNIENYSDVHVTGVTLDTTATTINKGATTTLVATVSPNDAYDKSVTWSTSDNTVATVTTGGVVTAIGCGEATITVTTTDGGYTAQCTTTVENPVTGISLNTNVAYIMTGGTYQLEATLTPSDACGDKSVDWTSSDNNIATASNNGLITAVAVGNAVITATTTVGSHTATCAVEVTEPVAVTSVTLNESTLALNVGDSETLIATVLPNNATDKAVTWSSDDSSIATVTSGGVVTAVSDGTATITVTTDDGGYTASCEVTVQTSIDYSQIYFTIESLEDNNAITFVVHTSTTGNLGYYSIDDGTTWTQIASGSGAKTIATLNSGDTVLIKATSQTSGQQAKWATAYNGNSYLNATKTYKVYGNAMSLLTGDDFATATTITQTFALCGLFYGGNNPTKLLDAKNLVLPATGLTVSSYNGMFRGCTSLQYGPAVLPALTIHQDTYASMFEGCRSLIEAPDIMATSGSGTCMARMFCMDRGSSAVSATMTKGPVLRIANVDSQNAYRDLFRCNGNITEVTILATSIYTGSNPALNSWLLGVPAIGVIKKLSALTTMPTNSKSGVPSGWSTQDID